MTVDMEKPQSSPRRGRLAFLRTKRAIAVLTALAIVSVILIGKHDSLGTTALCSRLHYPV